MGKKILYIAGTILEIAFIAGAFVLGWLPRAKLGFNRWVVHLNRSWEEQLPVDVLKIVILAVLAAGVIVLVVRLVRAPRKKALSFASLIAAAVLLGVCVWFTCAFSSEQQHSYYLMALCFALACLIQEVKAFAITGSNVRNSAKPASVSR